MLDDRTVTPPRADAALVASHLPAPLPAPLPTPRLRGLGLRLGALMLACAASIPAGDLLQVSLRHAWAPGQDPMSYEPLPERELDIGRASSVIAEVWNVPANTAASIVRASLEQGERHGLPASLLLGIIAAESGFKPQVRNGYGAVGLMQVVASVHADKLPAGRGHTALMEPELNIAVGARILSDCLRSADGNLTRALARYSGNARNYAQKVDRFRQAFEIALGDTDTPLTPPRDVVARG